MRTENTSKEQKGNDANGSAIRPPLGLMPKKFHDERVKVERFNEVCGAIARYYNAGMKINVEWIEEYNELVECVGKHSANRVLATVFIPWIKTKGIVLPINKSCLCLRNGKRVCNLYFDGLNWKDDGFDSKDSRVFTDVTHYILLKCVILP